MRTHRSNHFECVGRAGKYQPKKVIPKAGRNYLMRVFFDHFIGQSEITHMPNSKRWIRKTTNICFNSIQLYLQRHIHQNLHSFNFLGIFLNVITQSCLLNVNSCRNLYKIQSTMLQAWIRFWLYIFHIFVEILHPLVVNIE